MPDPAPLPTHPVIFFDGFCGLCDRFISWVLQQPTVEQFRFSPLQGETFSLIKSHFPDLEEVDSILLYLPKTDSSPARVLIYSDATLAILKRLSFPYSFLGKISCLFPRPVRNFVYKAIAARRLKIFGKRDSCRLPSTKERALFLE